MSDKLPKANKDFAVLPNTTLIASKINVKLLEILNAVFAVAKAEVTGGKTIGVLGGILETNLLDIAYARWGWEYRRAAEANVIFDTMQRNGESVTDVARILVADDVELTFEINLPIINRLGITAMFNPKSTSIQSDTVRIAIEGAVGYMYVGSVLKILDDILAEVTGKGSSINHTPVIFTT